MAKKKKKLKKKPKKSKKVSSKKVRKPVIPRKTIVNVPDKPIDPAKIERARKRKAKERQMEKEMGIQRPKVAKTSGPSRAVKSLKTFRIHPVISKDLVIKFKKDFDAKSPNYAYSDDAGLDIFSNEEKILRPMHRAPIKTGISFELPKGYVGLVWDKSGLSLRNGLHAMAGVVDSGYRGELKVILVNLSSKIMKIEKGVKIAQLLIQKIERARLQESNSLEESERGDGGYGSSGLKEIEKIEENDDIEDYTENEDTDDKRGLVLELDKTKKKSKPTVKIKKEKPHLKEIKKAIKEDTENHLF